MMNKEYKNFFGGLDADVDIDSSKDFVNQVTYNPNEIFDFLDGSEADDGGGAGGINFPDADGDGIPDAIDIDAGSGTGVSTVQDALEDRRKANKKQGLSAFAKGLTQGLGILQSPLSPSEGTEPKLGENSGLITETRNPVIPILIGLIGVAVLFFAISKSKKGNVRPMPMPTA
jgi:hypothetical protein